MKIEKGAKYVKIHGEEGQWIDVVYDNMGEPFRQGVSLRLGDGEYNEYFSIFLEDREAEALVEAIGKILSKEKRR